jgi:coenzyme F420-dependent glucose-6-phosphate dehydrogenase
MALIGYQASHEQFKPSELLKWCILAEQEGFQAINSSDHFYPWSERQGQSGFSFAWIGAVMQATRVPVGVVCTPGYRYHPAIVAQAVATYGEMFPERFWIALGSGEALNERMTGIKWPVKEERNKRLKECADIIRQLLRGETVSHYGYTITEEAKLYTRPEKTPLVIGAAVTVQTASWLGTWADGMITISQPYPELKKVVDAFRANGGNGKPIFLKVQLSFDKSMQAAEHGAFDQWRTNIFSGTVLGDLSRVEQFDALGEQVQPSQISKMVRISDNVQAHIDWLQEDVELGFERIILHNVNREQEYFIREFGQKVLPQLRR